MTKIGTHREHEMKFEKENGERRKFEKKSSSLGSRKV